MEAFVPETGLPFFALLKTSSLEGGLPKLKALTCFASWIFFTARIPKQASFATNKKVPHFLQDFNFVPETGFEPARHFQHHHLKVACLPISTPGLIIIAILENNHYILSGTFMPNTNIPLLITLAVNIDNINLNAFFSSFSAFAILCSL